MADLFSGVSAQSTPSVFNFGAHAVRIVVRDGEPWFVATDVAAALGYLTAKDAARNLSEHQKGGHILPTPGGEQRVTIINESGLYRLVLRSRKPEAEKFSDWVTGEVLPSIRKTGRYEKPAAEHQPTLRGRRWLMVDNGDGPPVITELAADAQIISQAEIAKQAHRARIEELQRQIAEQEKLAKDHRDTMFIYEKFAKTGDRAKWLSHVASAAQADWYAEVYKEQLRSLVPDPEASRANAVLFRQTAPGRLERAEHA